MTKEELIEDIEVSRILFINREYKLPKKIYMNEFTKEKLVDNLSDNKIKGIEIIVDNTIENDKFIFKN